MHDIRLDLIDDATVWTGVSLEGNRDWEYTLNNQDRSELASALAGVRRSQLRLEEISALIEVLLDQSPAAPRFSDK